MMATILLVDDNSLRAGLRTSILEELQGSIPTIVRVSDAAEALCLIEDAEFATKLDLVITVPFGAATSSISGVDFVSELRNRLARVAVLVLGAAGKAEAAYREIGGVYLSQTRVPQEMRALVQSLLHKDERRYA